ncbi:unnamed protein product [Cylicostephanus goldi]|uniref:Uncharacterized protein n=1 Tax=Cylicostephanus goldi TaxID=71465 RepID=A0A3P7PWG5_CYLGO|nr:unnamed protein product [Cylicostephanus goldi]
MSLAMLHLRKPHDPQGRRYPQDYGPSFPRGDEAGSRGLPAVGGGAQDWPPKTSAQPTVFPINKSINVNIISIKLHSSTYRVEMEKVRAINPLEWDKELNLAGLNLALR